MNRPSPDPHPAVRDPEPDPSATSERGFPREVPRTLQPPVGDREPETEARPRPDPESSVDPGGPQGPGTGPVSGGKAGQEPVEALSRRLTRVERSNRWLKLVLILVTGLAGYASLDKLFPDVVMVQRTLLESRELKLIDNSGQPRLFLRMYSRVPVLQVLDAKGKPRMSLGLRFDDTPFIDLSDQRGNTRATFEMTEEDNPALRLFNERGDVTFAIN
jgi:hypothetical protein